MLEKYLVSRRWKTNSTEDAHKIIEEQIQEIELKASEDFPYLPFELVERNSEVKIYLFGLYKKIQTSAYVKIIPLKNL